MSHNHAYQPLSDTAARPARGDKRLDDFRPAITVHDSLEPQRSGNRKIRHVRQLSQAIQQMKGFGLVALGQSKLDARLVVRNQ